MHKNIYVVISLTTKLESFYFVSPRKKKILTWATVMFQTGVILTTMSDRGCRDNGVEEF